MKLVLILILAIIVWFFVPRKETVEINNTHSISFLKTTKGTYITYGEYFGWFPPSENTILTDNSTDCTFWVNNKSESSQILYVTNYDWKFLGSNTIFEPYGDTSSTIFKKLILYESDTTKKCDLTAVYVDVLEFYIVKSSF
jgi:hypothetical protein